MTYTTGRNTAALARLQELAGPELYRRNTFRITGLPTDATHRTIRARQRRAEVAGSVGSVIGTAGDPALPEPPAPERLRAAFEELRDPQRRIVDELFWLWDTPDARCPCPGSVHQEHDRAVRAHARALDGELAEEWTDPDGPDPDSTKTCWADAGRTWTELLGDERMRAHLHHRVRALDDRRLDDSVVDALLDRLPRTLFMSVAALPATLVEPTKVAHLCGLWTGVGEDVVDEVLEEALEPLYERTAAVFATADELYGAGRYDEEARFLERELVPRLVDLEPFGSALAQRRAAVLCQAGSILLNNCAVALLDAPHAVHLPPEGITSLLDLAFRFSTDPGTREQISANRTTVPAGANGANGAGRPAPALHVPPAPAFHAPPAASKGYGGGLLNTAAISVGAAVGLGTATESLFVFLGALFVALLVIGVVVNLSKPVDPPGGPGPHGGTR